MKKSSDFAMTKYVGVEGAIYAFCTGSLIGIGKFFIILIWLQLLLEEIIFTFSNFSVGALFRIRNVARKRLWNWTKKAIQKDHYERGGGRVVYFGVLSVEPSRSEGNVAKRRILNHINYRWYTAGHMYFSALFIFRMFN